MKLAYIANDFDICHIRHPNWLLASSITIDQTWRGEALMPQFYTYIKGLWSAQFVYIQFCASIYRPMNLFAETLGDDMVTPLWEKDVFEFFIADNVSSAIAYKEFEIAPNGCYLDLAIEQGAAQRKTDYTYNSAMFGAVAMVDDQCTAALKIPWKAFDVQAKPGMQLKGNFYRICGESGNRQYMAWSPTMTHRPNFHVPARFGTLFFEPN